jgi:hypothetical protein
MRAKGIKRREKPKVGEATFKELRGTEVDYFHHMGFMINWVVMGCMNFLYFHESCHKVMSNLCCSMLL